MRRRFTRLLPAGAVPQNQEMPNGSEADVTYFARTNYRRDRRRFGIKRQDRRSHMSIIGRTGTGKSNLLETMACQDVENGEGFALIDPHGDLVERILKVVPEHRSRQVVYFNVPDRSRSLGFNPLAPTPPEKRALAASGLVEAFKKIWIDSWGPRLEHILRNALLALFDLPDATLADLPRLLEDREFRRSAALRVLNRPVADFWLREYEGYPPRFRAEAIAPLQNKVGVFLSNPLLHSILCQSKESFDLRRVMDEGQILLVNLAKGRIGEDTATLLGALLVSRIGLAGLSRADLPEARRRDFYLYLDEFPTFTTFSIVSMLSELRKYRIGLVLAHQYLTQLDPQILDAILGNVGTLISFRLGVRDAEILQAEFSPRFSEEDLINLPNHSIYLKLMVDGIVTAPFSADTVRARSPLAQ